MEEFRKQIAEIVDCEDSDRCKVDDILKLFIDFQLWKDNPTCPFSLHYDGLKQKGERISYDRLQGNYTLNEVMNFYVKNVLK